MAYMYSNINFIVYVVSLVVVPDVAATIIEIRKNVRQSVKLIITVQIQYECAGGVLRRIHTTTLYND